MKNERNGRSRVSSEKRVETSAIASQFDFDAFVSYRRGDSAWLARWIRNRLERFELPEDLIRLLSDEKKELHAKRPRIWLDRAYEKSSDDFLIRKIYPALDRSARLIVISSRTAFDPIRDINGTDAPNWLVREIEHFLGDNRFDSSPRPVDLVLGPGAPENRYPGRLAERNRWDWVDFRAYSRWKYSALSGYLDEGLAKLVAGLYDIPDSALPLLRGEEQRRRRRLFLTAASTFSIISILVGALGWIGWQATRNAAREARLGLVRQLAAQAQTILTQRPDSPTKGAHLAVEALRISQELGVRSLEADQSARVSLSLLPPLVARFTVQDNASGIAFTPDSRQVVTVGGRLSVYNLSDPGTKPGVSELLNVSNAGAFSWDRRYYAAPLSPIAKVGGLAPVGVWNVASGRLVQSVDHSAPVTAVALSRTGKYVLTAGQDKLATIWDVASRKAIRNMQLSAWGTIAKFSDDDQYVALVQDKVVQVWELASDRSPLTLTLDAMIRDIVFAPDGSEVITGADDGITTIWNTRMLRITPLGMKGGAAIRSVVLALDGRHVGTADENNVYRVWNLVNQMEVAHFQGGVGAIASVSFSPDGRFLAGGQRIWDWRSGSEVARTTWAPIISPDGKYLAEASGPEARIWRWPNEPPFLRLERVDTENPAKGNGSSPYIAVSGPTGGLWDLSRMQNMMPLNAYRLSFDQSGFYVAGSSREKEVFALKVGRGEPFCRVPYSWPEIEGGNACIIATALSPNGNYLAAMSSDPNAPMELWSTDPCRRIAQLQHGVGSLLTNALVFSPDGTRLFAASPGDTHAGLWEVPSGRKLLSLAHESEVIGLGFARGGRLLVTGSRGGVVHVWDDTGRPLSSASTSPGMNVLSLSTIDPYVVSGNFDGTAEVFKGDRLQRVGRLMHGGAPVRTAEFSSDGAYLATGADDGFARIWEVGTWREVSRISNDQPVWRVAFADGDKYLVTASGRSGPETPHLTTRVWLWRPADMIAEACRRLPDQLTREDWMSFSLGSELFNNTCAEVARTTGPSGQ